VARARNLARGVSVEEIRRACTEDWLPFVGGEYAACAKIDPASPVQRADCEFDVELVRALRAPIPFEMACPESSVCSFLARPTEEEVRRKEKAFVSEFCGQWVRRAESPVIPPLAPVTTGPAPKEAR